VIPTGAAARMILMGMIVASLFSCATVHEKTESYILAEDRRLAPPIDAWLRTVEIVSNNLPLSDDYALIRDSLAAIAFRHGFLLSPTQGRQPYVIDLVVHERSYAVDLEPSSSVMAVLNLSFLADDSRCAARVVYTAVTPDSVVSLYQVTEIAENIFASLSRALVDEEARATAKKGADAKAAPAP
jgi:hypothetical protein